MPALVYLHGFRSSPASFKAVRTLEFLRTHYPYSTLHVPALSFDVAATIRKIDALLASIGKVSLIGSSLGGYYANYFAERYGLRAVLINPAVHPYTLLEDYLGPQHNPYTGEYARIDRASLAELKKLSITEMQNPSDRMVMLQTGDEVLDYREAARIFEASRLYIETGGNHSYVDYPIRLPAITRFLEL